MRSYSVLLLTGCFLLASCGHSRRLHRAEREQPTTKVHNPPPKHDQKYTPESYIEAWKGTAIQQMKQFGIPASITMAQALLESANGNSQLAREANNHFGIKCTNDWTGKTYHKDDNASNDCWRKYANAAESFSDHSRFLQKSRYASLFKNSRTDYKAWAYGLQKTGYATNPKYPELLLNMIKKYNLTQYDR